MSHFEHRTPQKRTVDCVGWCSVLFITPLLRSICTRSSCRSDRDPDLSVVRTRFGTKTSVGVNWNQKSTPSSTIYHLHYCRKPSQDASSQSTADNVPVIHQRNQRRTWHLVPGTGDGCHQPSTRMMTLGTGVHVIQIMVHFEFMYNDNFPSTYSYYHLHLVLPFLHSSNFCQ